jgi:NAD(P)-dependent dehydrogenase (short-subunit alcohol dehydrogenase family)
MQTSPRELAGGVQRFGSSQGTAAAERPTLCPMVLKHRRTAEREDPMSLFDAFSYKGKRALVVGGASGMGAAVAELVLDAGAEVVVMDRAAITLPGVKTVSLNLADTASIDAAIAQSGGPFNAVFSCAGVADGTPGIEKINFLGHRYMIERLLAGDLLPRGSAIGMISSAAGLGWEGSLTELHEYLDIADFDKAAAWAQERNKADYMWSKKAINAYVGREALALLKKGVRINAILPGPTDTPLAQANRDMWLGFGADYRAEAGIEASTPLEQAYPLVFLCSDAAAGITGITMITDAGYYAAGVTGSFATAQEAIGFLRSI